MRRLRYVSDDLPFDFNCGFVGYLGYELKADCGGDRAHRSSMPDAAFVFADRLIAFDHVEQTHLRPVRRRATTASRRPSAGSRDDEPAARLAAAGRRARLGAAVGERDDAPVAFSPEPLAPAAISTTSRPASGELIDGETYEICLTNKVTAEVRRRPAAALPHAAPRQPGAVLGLPALRRARPCSAPRPSASCRSGAIAGSEAKPIKGTCARGATPAEDVRLAEELRADEKDRAENLMIVDLLRNDLGVVCEVGTVHVPNLMHVETYETVHQLVSTVRGLLREDVEPPDCVRACFPGGSMTGAPKKRTMEIIDELEGEARGVYSGAIGYSRAQRRRRPQHRHPHDRDRRRARRRSASAARS